MHVLQMISQVFNKTGYIILTQTVLLSETVFQLSKLRALTEPEKIKCYFSEHDSLKTQHLKLTKILYTIDYP